MGEGRPTAIGGWARARRYWCQRVGESGQAQEPEAIGQVEAGRELLNRETLYAGCGGSSLGEVGCGKSWGLAGGGTGHGHLARQSHGYINVPWRRRGAAGSSKLRMAQAERDCLILSGNTTSHTLLPKPQAWAGTACSL